MVTAVEQGLQDFIILSKYARYIPELKRRETWEEAIERVMKMHVDKFKHLPPSDIARIIWAFELAKNKRVLPSMRSVQFGGAAVLAHNARLFNCSVRFVDSIRAFAEIAYLMLCGCGTGIGVYKKYLNRLPDLVGPEDRTGTVVNYVVEDNIEGWCDSLEALLNCYTKNNAFSGRKIVFDYSRIRRKGSPLKTGGGKAPGHVPLKNAHAKIKSLVTFLIEDRNQQRLKSIDVVDILLHFADAVLSGGVRRTASSVMFEPDDVDMMEAKTSFQVKKYRGVIDQETNEWHGKVWYQDKSKEVVFKLDNSGDKYAFEELKNNKIGWYYVEPQRARSNNSVRLLRNECNLQQFRDIISKTRQYGEPGFVFCNSEDTLMNPCFEISFVPVTTYGECGVQFCNLSSINGARVKSKEDFKECVEAETIIGTLQTSYTDFKYLSRTAKQLTDEEALLGNSITGILDSPDIILQDEFLVEMAKYAVEVNRKWAKKLGVNPAARINCVKPEGTGSLAVGAAPGIHPHHAKKYFRRIQNSLTDNIHQFFKLHNPHMVEESVWNTNTKEEVITFPIQIKEGAIVKKDLSAIEHLEIIKRVQQSWVLPSQDNNKKDVSHNVSCTVIVKEDEWDKVIAYIFSNREYFSAVSFIPDAGDKLYQQAPFEAVVTQEDEEKFAELIEQYIPVDYTKMIENSDGTVHMAEASCAGGACLV